MWMSAYSSKADIPRVRTDVRYVPIADINHHLFSAVVIVPIRLVQLGGSVEIRPSTPWNGSLQSAPGSVT